MAEIKVKLTGDNADLQRKLHESSEASREFAKEFAEGLGEAKDALGEVAGEAGLGMVTAGLTGGTAAAVAFGAAIVEAVKGGIEEITELEKITARFSTLLGDKGLGKEMTEFIDNISGVGGNKEDLADAMSSLLKSGMNPDKAKDTIQSLQKMAVGSGVDIKELGEAWAKGFANDWTNLERILRSHPDIAHAMKEFITPAKKDDSALMKKADSDDREIESLQKQYADKQAEIARIEKGIHKPAGALSAAEDQQKKDEINALKSSLSGKGDSVLKAAEARSRAASDQVQKDEMARLQLRERKAKTPLERRSIKDEISSKQASMNARDEQTKSKENIDPNHRIKTLDEISVKTASIADQRERSAEHLATENEHLQKQKAELDEIGKKLQQKGFSQLDTLSKAQNLGDMTIHEQIKSGNVGPDAMDRVLEGMTTGTGIYSHALTNAAETLDGKSKELNESVDRLKAALGEPIVEALKPILDELITALPTLTENAKQFGQSLAEVIKNINETMVRFFPEMKPKGTQTIDDKENIAGRNALGELMKVLYMATPLSDSLGGVGIGPKGFMGGATDALGKAVGGASNSIFGKAPDDLKDAARELKEATAPLKDAMTPKE